MSARSPGRKFCSHQKVGFFGLCAIQGMGEDDA